MTSSFSFHQNIALTKFDAIPQKESGLDTTGMKSYHSSGEKLSLHHLSVLLSSQEYKNQTLSSVGSSWIKGVVAGLARVIQGCCNTCMAVGRRDGSTLSILLTRSWRKSRGQRYLFFC